MLKWLFSSRIGAHVYHALTANYFWTRTFSTALCDAPNRAQATCVLDMGCGPGGSTRTIAKQLAPSARIVGVDISEPMLQIARHIPTDSHAAQITYLHGDITSLPFDDNVFDLIVGNSVLYLCDAPVDVLREVRRLLRPGGQVLFVEPSQEGRIYQAVLSVFGHIKHIARHPLAGLVFGYALTRWRLLNFVTPFPSRNMLKRWLQDANLHHVQLNAQLGGLTWVTTATSPTKAQSLVGWRPTAQHELADCALQR